MEIPQYLLDRKREIARRIIEAENKQRGCIRLATNSSLVDTAYSIVNSMGYSKKFLSSKQQCIIDCFLSDIEICDRLLTSTILAGPLNDQLGTDRWNGLGRYQGWCGAMNISNFSLEYNSRAIFVVNLEPVFDQFKDILKPIQELD